MAQINAVDEAIRGLSGIPFVEFTSSLIQGVFETLVDTQLTQMTAFTDMFEEISLGMATYINSTADDVDDAMTLTFLQNLPVANDPSASGTAGATVAGDVQAGLQQLSANAANPVVTLGAQVLNIIKDRVDVPGLTNPLPAAAAGGGNAAVPVDLLKRAIAQRIAANRYSALENMMRMGLMRLVIDHGLIETRLTFSTFEEHTDEVKVKEKNRDKEKTLIKNGVGPFVRLFANKKNKTKSKTVNVKQVKELHRDVSGSSVKFYSRVVLNFKTDFMPLNQ